MKHTYGSLFTGVGGFDIGFDRAGYDCRWQVEWDKHCQQTLAYHWPDVPRWSDVCDVNGADLPPVDVITYGSPCQDLSVAGKRAGIEGGRSSMFFEATRIIKEMRDATGGTYPRITIWENVPGSLRSNKGRDFAKVLDSLADIGAVDIEWAVLDAAFFRIPARRRRIFVIANYNPDKPFPARQSVLPLSKSNRRHTVQSEENVVSFYRTFGEQDQPQRGIAPTLKAIAPVCVAGHGGNPRTLTPIEHERLMGWPDNHTLHRADGKTNSDSTRYKMCGNGVASPVAHWIAYHLEYIL
jgi:DNA (cytosine-5)-methyltransferase 1